jgi:hypothetical protein
MGGEERGEERGGRREVRGEMERVERRNAAAAAGESSERRGALW